MIAEPFKHTVIDGCFPVQLLREAAAAWPRDHGWVHYTSDLEKKRTLHEWELIPPPLQLLLGRMALLPVEEMLSLSGPLVPDLSLWGAGLHEMGVGDHLDLHLDGDVHPRLGLARRANAILFLQEKWKESWGGSLQLWDAERSRPVVEIVPWPGRLVVFEASDISYHAVTEVDWLADVARKSMALYFWGKPMTVSKRPRALFLPSKDEPPNLVKEKLREARSR